MRLLILKAGCEPTPLGYSVGRPRPFMDDAAVALHFPHYNFVRIHKTLRVIPAMAAGVTGKLWEIADLVALLPDEDSNWLGLWQRDRERRPCIGR